MTLDDDLVLEALQRIARTPDGRVFHLALQKSLMALSPTADSGALQIFEGGRRFAHQIKAALDKGLAENLSDGSSAERPIIFVARRATPSGRRGGAERRVRDADGASG